MALGMVVNGCAVVPLRSHNPRAPLDDRRLGRVPCTQALACFDVEGLARSGAQQLVGTTCAMHVESGEHWCRGRARLQVLISVGACATE